MLKKFKTKLRNQPYDFENRIVEENEFSDIELDLNLGSACNIKENSSDNKIGSDLENFDLNLETIPRISINNFDTMSLPFTPSAPTAPTNPSLVTPTDIVNSLKIPDAIRDLSKFNGNPRLLFDFIKNVEEILTLITPVDGTPYGTILLRAIRNKIEGPANEVLDMYGTSLEWQQIKNNLILHYSDKRNEASLIRDLHCLRQNSKTIEQFYSEIIEILSTANNLLQIHENNANVLVSKRNLYSEMCLNVFLTGLKEPLGSTIRAMKPSSLAEAFSYCVKEQNIFYFKSSNFHSTHTNHAINKPHTPQKLFKPTFTPQPTGFRPYNNFNYQMGPHFKPQHTITYQKPIYNTPNWNRNRRPMHQPNQTPFPQAKPSFSAQRSFVHPQQNNFNLPQPMDVDSGFSRYKAQSNNFLRANNSNNPTKRELHNITEQNFFDPNVETYEYYDYNPEPDQPEYPYQQNLDQYYDQAQEVDNSDSCNEIDDVNFRIKASENKSDI